MEQISLEMKGIVKQFPGVLALDSADFTLKKGEVHALLGINGAGKSTLIKVLSGVYKKDGGSIAINGESVELGDPKASRKLGVATVYQDPQMISSFTGYENIFLGRESEKRGLFPRIERRKLLKRAEALLDKFPVDIDLKVPVSRLEAVEKESIAILRALSQEKMDILILDEPTSILTHKEIQILFERIRHLKENGISIIYITHRLDEVFEVADRFTVFRNGKNVGTHATSEKGMDHNYIAELMLGDKLEKIYPEKSGEKGDCVLEARSLSLGETFREVSFNLNRGEVLGIFGLVGSGIDELSKALFGNLALTGGSLEKGGTSLKLNSCAAALEEKIYLIPGDRRKEGQIGDESIGFNMTLSNINEVSRFGLVRGRAEAEASEKLITALDVRPRDRKKKVGLLSGGNQQKVVIAKGLFTDSDVYIFCEPTVGVDVGAKAGIYQIIRELSQKKGVIVIGSDCEEIYGVCDRAMVLYKGRVVLNKPADQIRLEEMLVHGLTGGDKNEQ